LVIGGWTQAFCSSDDCPVITWNPSLPDGGLSNPSFVNLEGESGHGRSE
jgi:hypothetical protein